MVPYATLFGKPLGITSWTASSICCQEDVHLFSIVSAPGSKSALSMDLAGLRHWSNYNLAAGERASERQ